MCFWIEEMGLVALLSIISSRYYLYDPRKLNILDAFKYLFEVQNTVPLFLCCNRREDFKFEN